MPDLINLALHYLKNKNFKENCILVQDL